MDSDIFNAIDTEILFLLRDMKTGKKELPHKKELIKIKSLLKNISLKDFPFINEGGVNMVGVPNFDEGIVKFNLESNSSNYYSKTEMKYVFYEASLFLSVILKSLISHYLDNNLIEALEPTEGSRIPVELSVLIWYARFLEDIHNKRLVHDSIGKYYIQLFQYKNEFENVKFEKLRDIANNDFKETMSKISAVEQKKFGDIAKNTIDNIVGYYKDLQKSATSELAGLKKAVGEIKDIRTDNDNYKIKIEDIYKHCQTRKGSIDDVFIASNKQGMAKSFQDMALELQRSINLWLFAFVISLVIVAWNGYLLNSIVNKQVVATTIAKGDANTEAQVRVLPDENIDKNNTPLNADVNANSNAGYLSTQAIVVRVLMTAPFLWLAWFSGRQYSHNNKLRQDYIYKSAVAMAYQGYKEESAEMGSEMHNKLLENIVGHFSDNPVRLYEKSEPSSPLEDLIKKLSPEGVAELIKALKAKG